MPMKPIDRELLRRYVSGQASADECARVEAWLAEDAERWEQLGELRDEIAEAALSNSAVEQAKAEVWARLEPEIGQSAEVGTSARPGSTGRPREFAPSSRRSWPTRVQLAAGLILALVGGAALGVLLLGRRPPAPSEAVRVATTEAGQRATLRLADGTRVMLGVASMLRYPTAFSNGAREVSLEGEAYFEVVHDGGRRFAVRAGDLIATDLGTQFTVRAYPEDAGALVVVREGRVGVRAAAGSAEQAVAPGQLARLGPDRRPTVQSADTAFWFAWTQGRLVFDGTPLRDALPQLGRWFDLEFRLADSALGDVPLNATLRTQATPDVLNGLAASLGLRHRRAGRVVTLY